MSHQPITNRRIKVLIVDDSASVRTLLAKLLSSDPMIEIVGQAEDAYVAREMLVKYTPDVMTLDIEMPRLDGLNFLEKVMQHFPTRTLIISSLSPKGSQTALKAVAMGAVDVIPKSLIDVSRGVSLVAEELSAMVRAAAAANISHLSSFAKNNANAPSSPTANVGSGLRQSTQNLPGRAQNILAIAASTGGPDALRQLLSQLPAQIPPTLIVQHMPAFFTKSLADSLNSVCAFQVREALDGDTLEQGVALIAPGNFHMVLAKVGGRLQVRLNQNPAVHGVRPAADPLFVSIAQYLGRSAIGVVLTGMGRDGADGLLKMREAGSYNIAQDEDSCVVFGMPREAIDIGAVQIISPLAKIPALIMAELARRAVAKVG
ncbi:chemotaxis response regulator protein-glutamate methylesterase [bacterium]|nr:chemotaxis response regulator protein-glutamate methylesterase [bacterium]